ncbi:MAG: hypothetical protein OEZ06_09895 [Myxococcales bacterium]|nr:hypothetical protein [Myxococcales bacterium]
MNGAGGPWRALPMVIPAYLAMACGGGDEPQQPPSRERSRGVPEFQAPMPNPDAPAAAAARPPRPGSTAPASPRPSTDPGAEAEAQAEAEAEEKKRDYAAELKAAFGSPLGCMGQREAGEQLPPRITLQLQAHVLDSGRITRGYVSAPGLQAQELSCLERQLRAARLPGAIEGAPRQISTTVGIEFKAAAAAAKGP